MYHFLSADETVILFSRFPLQFRFSLPLFVLDTHILHRSLSLPRDFFLLIISSHLHLFKPLSTDLDPFQYSPNLLIHHKFWTSYIKAHLSVHFPPPPAFKIGIAAIAPTRSLTGHSTSKWGLNYVG